MQEFAGSAYYQLFEGWHRPCVLYVAHVTPQTTQAMVPSSVWGTVCLCSKDPKGFFQLKPCFAKALEASSALNTRKALTLSSQQSSAEVSVTRAVTTSACAAIPEARSFSDSLLGLLAVACDVLP